MIFGEWQRTHNRITASRPSPAGNSGCADAASGAALCPEETDDPGQIENASKPAPIDRSVHPLMRLRTRFVLFRPGLTTTPKLIVDEPANNLERPELSHRFVRIACSRAHNETSHQKYTQLIGDCRQLQHGSRKPFFISPQSYPIMSMSLCSHSGQLRDSSNMVPVRDVHIARLVDVASMRSAED